MNPMVSKDKIIFNQIRGFDEIYKEIEKAKEQNEQI